MDHPSEAVEGRVYIVGAGPGDPGLLTLKGARLLAEADVVFYDDLIDRRLLEHTRPGCERVHAGHRGGASARRQEELSRRLVAEARAGRRVVRLKGGDPYIFGRGGEEALALAEAGVPFEVVCGVSAASGAPAYAGIPLTHRGLAAAAVLVTGHEDPSKPESGVDWPSLARVPGTLVVFMGSRKVSAICEALIAGGRAPETPAAAIQWGTWPRQQTVTGTLASLAAEVAAAGLASPTLIVVGEVVNLRGRLSWFETRPLFGRRILITRSREQAGPLRLMLESEGAEVHLLPLLEIGPPDDWTALDGALSRLADFAWVVFTSPNSVEFFHERLRRLGRDSRAYGPARVAAVGLSTGQLLRERGIEPDLVPEVHSAAGLAAAFEAVDLAGAEILLPASSIGRTELDESLAGRGALVFRVTAYENRPPDPASVELPEALTGGSLDCVVFASPSSVRNFLAVAGRETGLEHLRRLDVAAIGPTTARAVADLGLNVAVQPGQSSVSALVRALCEHYGGRR